MMESFYEQALWRGNWRQQCIQDLRDKRTYRAAAAEVMGTFLLTFFVCILRGGQGQMSQISFSLGYGASLAAVGYFTHLASGGHNNPAITLSFAVTNNISLARALLYFFAQIIGSLAATEIAVVSSLSHCSLPSSSPSTSPHVSLTLTPLPPPESGYGGGIVFLVEGIVSLLIIFVVFSTSVDPNGHPTITPLASGIATFSGSLVSFSITNSSLNPLLFLSPALVCNQWGGGGGGGGVAWAYILAPLSAAVVGGLLYQHVFLLRRMDSIAGSSASFQRDDYDLIGRFASVNVEDRN